MVAHTRKRGRNNSPRKFTSRKKPRKSSYVKTLEKRIEALELKQLNKPANVQEINQRVEKLEQEKTEKPISGHVEAGSKWSQSPKGQEWEKDIKNAQEMLDTKLKAAGYDMSASGVYARKLAGLIRKSENPKINEDPIDIEKSIELIVKEIKTKTQSASKQLKPLSPKRLLNLQPQDFQQQNPQLNKGRDILTSQNNIGDPQNFQQQNPQIFQQQNNPKPLIGGFFDDSSDDDN
jgi:hypothetical protein